MRKRSIFIVIFVVIVSLALMGLDVYENKKEKLLLRRKLKKFIQYRI